MYFFFLFIHRYVLCWVIKPLTRIVKLNAHCPLDVQISLWLKNWFGTISEPNPCLNNLMNAVSLNSLYKGNFIYEKIQKQTILFTADMIIQKACFCHFYNKISGRLRVKCPSPCVESTCLSHYFLVALTNQSLFDIPGSPWQFVFDVINNVYCTLVKINKIYVYVYIHVESIWKWMIYA